MSCTNAADREYARLYGVDGRVGRGDVRDSFVKMILKLLAELNLADTSAPLDSVTVLDQLEDRFGRDDLAFKDLAQRLNRR